MTLVSPAAPSPGAPRSRYKKVLLKVSGEVLMGDTPYGIDMNTVDAVAREVAEIVALGVELCLVIGGGNIFRGLSGAAKGMERASADYMGMLATVMNALAVQNALERHGVETRVQSACGTWRRAGWLSSPPAPAIPSSPPTPPQPCAPPRSAATC